MPTTTKADEPGDISETEPSHPKTLDQLQARELRPGYGELAAANPETLPARNASLAKANPAQASIYDQTIMIVIMGGKFFTLFVGYIGNSIVMAVICRYTRTQTVTDVYIMNLAIADFTFLSGLIFLIITSFAEHWIFGSFMCKMFMGATALNQFASSLLLVAMSCDRYLAVCCPLKSQRIRRPENAKFVCKLIWGFSLVLMSPIFAFSKMDDESTCAIYWPDGIPINSEVIFTLYSFGFGFFLPLIAIAFFYCRVVTELKRKAREGANINSERMIRQRQSSNRRVEYLVIAIILCYSFCWAPYWIIQLYVSFSTMTEHVNQSFYSVVLVATCLSYLNSALNPILYAFLSDKFKKRSCEVVHNALVRLRLRKRAERQPSAEHRHSDRLTRPTADLESGYTTASLPVALAPANSLKLGERQTPARNGDLELQPAEEPGHAHDPAKFNTVVGVSGAGVDVVSMGPPEASRREAEGSQMSSMI